MEKKTEVKNWFQTLPGVLTAVAGLISAITALIVALSGGKSTTGSTDHNGRPPPADRPQYTVRMSDIDDKAELYINGTLSYTAKWGYQGYEPSWFPFPEFGGNVTNSKPGDSKDIDITPKLQTGENTLRFILWDSGLAPGGASLSISVKRNGEEVIKDSCSMPSYTTPQKPSLVCDKPFHIQY